jgi:kynurenine formamidase
MPAICSTRSALLSLSISTTFLFAACSAPPAPPPAAPPSPGALVDLSHAYDAQTLFWPTAERFTLKKVSDGETPGGYYYAANWFSMEEHGGTHIDAPRHFAADRWTVDEIPLDRLRGPAAVVDVSAQAKENADYQVTTEDLQAWERAHGQFSEGALVLLRTGFSARWPDAATYLGTADRGAAAVANLHFPGLHPDAARWLVENRQVHAVGIDTASIDFGQSTAFQSHRTLFAANVPAFENLTQLDELPPTGATVLALPMKIGGGSGAPLRAVGILPSTP